MAIRIPIISDVVDVVVSVFSGKPPTPSVRPKLEEESISKKPVGYSGEVPFELGIYTAGPQVTIATTPSGETVSAPLLVITGAVATAGDFAYQGLSYAYENPVSAAQAALTGYSYYKNPKKLLSDLGVPDLTKYIPKSKPSYDPFQGTVNNQNEPDQTAVFISNQSKASALLIFAAVAGVTFLMLKKKGK